ncbi:hypothetical protein V6N13_071860 [Hibiscus sabdariffa]|uniref:40S ribosomal protein S27 n=1 Tax=Hibiscus sabdariffa TaxID=183260 RepID=A0ABR2TCH6_9ROSI
MEKAVETTESPLLRATDSPTIGGKNLLAGGEMSRPLAASDRLERKGARLAPQTLTPPATSPPPNMGLQNDIDLLNPPVELEKKKHKLKRLVQTPNSFFMDVKCQGCFNITTVFSHSQTVVVCGNCQTVLCQPTGGKARLTEGCSFRRKGD